MITFLIIIIAIEAFFLWDLIKIKRHLLNQLKDAYNKIDNPKP